MWKLKVMAFQNEELGGNLRYHKWSKRKINVQYIILKKKKERWLWNSLGCCIDEFQSYCCSGVTGVGRPKGVLFSLTEVVNKISDHSSKADKKGSLAFGEFNQQG